MLKLTDIKKTYKIGDIETRALNGINVAFREKEFVAILGASGSGKTTCLNIIGGLDRYDSGEMTIKGKKTKHFKERDWDAYRNNSIGFVFQSYNLISHLSIVSNVELSMTLSGVSASEKRRRALHVLEQVGLKEHLHKKPNQLSGGQMQRVAIARALVNDPEILLCDEPTGALDTITSRQILDIIKNIAKDRLVIMVTHNPELAEKYADRIIQFEDGKIVSDSNPYSEEQKEANFSLKKTSMSFFTALNLSFKNIRTKKGRAFLTSFASSIGIIGIAVILSLSTGFKIKIDEFQRNAMSEFPIIISPNAMKLDEDSIKKMEQQKEASNSSIPSGSGELTAYDPDKQTFIHKNVITEEYIRYINRIDPKMCSSIGYVRLASMNMVRKVGNKVVPVSINSGVQGMSSGSAASMGGMTSTRNSKLSSYPVQLSKGEASYLERNYTLLAGNYPTDQYDLVLVVDEKNRLSIDILKSLGFKDENIKFNNLVGTEFKLVDNNDFYVETEMGTYLPNTDYKAMYNSKRSLTLRISGVVRHRDESEIGLLATGLVYSDELSKTLIKRAINSDIVKAQEYVDYNIITLKKMSPEEKDIFLSVLGGKAAPFIVMLYPRGFEAKDEVVKYLDAYNADKPEDKKIVYTDLASTISSLTGGIMNGITLVLIAFAAISLVVSLIMISIITYTSVLERTKEIGILRALGARKKDITRVFDAETCILGVLSGVLGVSIAYLCIIPINSLIYKVAELENAAQLKILYAISLVAISTVLTMLGGHIPARMASKKDAVEALRSE